MRAPEKIRPRRLGDYLEVLTRAAFQAGMHWQVIEAKWPGFREAFHDFDPETVANLDPHAIDALAVDRRIVRNRPKIEATVANAATLIRLDDHGGFRRWLRSHGDYDATSVAVAREFRYIGDSSAYYFLWVVNEPVPDFETWASQRGITPGQPRRATSATR